MTSIITRHLSDHHAVQGEAEYVERHAPVTASHTPPKETAMTTYMQRDGRITSAATDDMPERIWLDADSYNGAVGFAHPEKHKKDGWPVYIRADLCATVQVRSLEWTPGTYTTRDDDGGKREGFPRRLFAWMAENYLIIQQDSPDGLFLLRGKSDGTGLAVPTLEAAKAAAQADYERRILAALTASPGWQPIETAPRDGTRVLFWLADEGFPCLASWRKWDGYEGFYLWEMGDFADHNLPTHWMPLPAAPEAEGGSDER